VPDEDLPSEPPIPDAVELRYPAAGIVWRVTLSLLLAVGASLLLAAFLQVPLMHAAARIGAAGLLLIWILLLALFGGWVGWQSRLFILRADSDGIRRDAGWEHKIVKWTDVSLNPSPALSNDVVAGALAGSETPTQFWPSFGERQMPPSSPTM